MPDTPPVVSNMKVVEFNSANVATLVLKCPAPLATLVSNIVTNSCVALGHRPTCNGLHNLCVLYNR